MQRKINISQIFLVYVLQFTRTLVGNNAAPKVNRSSRTTTNKALVATSYLYQLVPTLCGLLFVRASWLHHRPAINKFYWKGILCCDLLKGVARNWDFAYFDFVKCSWVDKNRRDKQVDSSIHLKPSSFIVKQNSLF